MSMHNESQTARRAALTVPHPGQSSSPVAPPKGGAFSWARLDNNGITSESFSARYAAIICAGVEKRAGQWQIVEQLKTRRNMLSYQRANAPRLAMATCRTVPIPYEANGGKTQLWLSPSGYGWCGLMTCDCPWCLICSRKRIYERAARITAGLGKCHTEGGPSKAYFVTLTIPRSSDIHGQLGAISRGWKKVQDVLDYSVRKKGKAQYWTCRALDVTFRPNTRAVYHTHLHCIIMTDIRKDAAWIDAEIGKAWLRSNPDALRQCQHVEEVRSQGIGRYCAKLAGLGMELSAGLKKSGRGRSMSFAQLVQAGMVRNDYARMHVDPVYVEFLQALKGRRSMTFSRNWTWKPPEEEEAEQRPEGLAVIVPLTWRKAVLSRLDTIGRYAWQDSTMAEGMHVRDLRNLIEDTPDEELMELDMHGEIIHWIDTMAAQVYDQVARVYDSDLRRGKCHLRRE
jgi:hypothetical protein